MQYTFNKFQHGYILNSAEVDDFKGGNHHALH